MRQRLRRWSAREVAPAVAMAALVVLLAGCDKMDTALSKQWITVQFTPETTMATALHVRAACSRIQNAPPMTMPGKWLRIDTMYGVRFDTTNASPANLAQLQMCLQQFKSVVGVNQQSAGDAGS